MCIKRQLFLDESLNFHKFDQCDDVIKVLINYGRKRQVISEIYFENRHTWCVSGLRVEHAPRVS